MNAKPEDSFNESEHEILDSSTAIEAINRSEIDVQIATAHKFPRSLGKFKQEALTMATLDEETAASCFYALKRGDKIIEGPSVRLAEIVGSAWGNLRYGSRIISVDDRFVTAQGACHDLERNISATIEVKRRITGKDGRRYGDDMIGVTSMAAVSIALRNAIFKVIPFTYAKSVYEGAKQTAVGSAKTLSSKRQAMVEFFGKMGVSEKMILDSLDKKNLEDIGLEELAILKGFHTAIKDGDTTIEQTFHKKPVEAIIPPEELRDLLIAHLRDNFSYLAGLKEVTNYIKAIAKSMNIKESEMWQKTIDGIGNKEQFEYWKAAFESFTSHPVNKPVQGEKKKGNQKKATSPTEKPATKDSSVESMKGKVMTYLSGLGLPSKAAIDEKMKQLSQRGEEFLTLDDFLTVDDPEWIQEILAKTKGV